MLLPFRDLPTDHISTLYTFSKAMHDLDRAQSQGTPFYFTKAAFLNLPPFNADNLFYRFRKTTSTPQGDIQYYSEKTTGQFPELEALNNAYINPNKVIPRLFQYHTENLIRQDIQNTEVSKRITEIAFFHTLKLMLESPKDCITHTTDISLMSFESVANNNGWSRVVASIPPTTPLRVPPTQSPLTSPLTIYNTFDPDDAIFDDDTTELAFKLTTSDFYINHSETDVDYTTQRNISFNVILLYYKDHEDIDKLYGVVFLSPFTQRTTGYELDSFSFVTNSPSTFGYTFEFLVKSCQNESTLAILQERDPEFFNTFQHITSRLDSFIATKEQEQDIL